MYKYKKGFSFRKKFLFWARKELETLIKLEDENHALRRDKHDLENELTDSKKNLEKCKKEYKDREKKASAKARTDMDNVNVELEETRKKCMDLENANAQLREIQMAAERAVKDANAQLHEMGQTCRSQIKKYRSEALKYQAALGNISYAELSDEDPNNCTRYETDMKRFRHHILQLTMPTKIEAANPKFYHLECQNFIPDYKIETMQYLLVRMAIHGILDHGIVRWKNTKTL